MKDNNYDLIIVGTGFASTFFLHRYLEKIPATSRILVLEAGPRRSHSDHLRTRDTDDHPTSVKFLAERYTNLTPEKIWVFNQTFGGGSNCWWACTPRLMPEDFRLKSLYGMGDDWPLDYDELEPYYCDAEDLMNVSGDSGDSPYRRSRPYPNPPHRMSNPDKALKKAFPNEIFIHPTARASESVEGQRPACCNNGVCSTCPIDAKFTVINGLSRIYDDPRIELKLNAKVVRLERAGDLVSGVAYIEKDREHVARCALAVLGANAMFNPHILLRSGFKDEQLGRGLCEQVTRSVWMNLDGLDNFQGSTVSTALGYMLYRGRNRERKAAALMQTVNGAGIRNVRGKWRQTLALNFIFEDLRLPENRVGIDPNEQDKPTATFVRRSDHTERGLSGLSDEIGSILAALPVEDYEIGEPWRTESHIMGTTVMGRDPASSVVDRFGIHHGCRNLAVLGSGMFPTAAPANPTLTLSALALRCADHLLS
jgi:choline dehydrogenase-like flavoprotein